MVGFDIPDRVRSMAVELRESARFSASVFVEARRIQLRSAPAEKCLPRPGQHDHRARRHRRRVRRGGRQLGDELLVEGVEHCRRSIQIVGAAAFDRARRY